MLDNIFINFDDDRTRAGIEVLAEFAQKTQVLLLTHHARTLELAKKALMESAWMEHRLDPTVYSASQGTVRSADACVAPINLDASDFVG